MRRILKKFNPVSMLSIFPRSPQSSSNETMFVGATDQHPSDVEGAGIEKSKVMEEEPKHIGEMKTEDDQLP
jgi:hypothetical protein